MQQARATQITAQHPELPGIHVMQVLLCCSSSASVPSFAADTHASCVTSPPHAGRPGAPQASHAAGADSQRQRHPGPAVLWLPQHGHEDPGAAT